MLTFLLPLAAKIIKDAVSKIPENEELGEKMVEICLVTVSYTHLTLPTKRIV